MYSRWFYLWARWVLLTWYIEHIFEALHNILHSLKTEIAHPKPTSAEEVTNLITPTCQRFCLHGWIHYFCSPRLVMWMSMSVHSNWKTTMIQCNKTIFFCKLVHQTNSPTPKAAPFFAEKMIIPFCPYRYPTTHPIILETICQSVSFDTATSARPQLWESARSTGLRRSLHPAPSGRHGRHPIDPSALGPPAGRWGEMGEEVPRLFFALRWDIKCQMMLEKMLGHRRHQQRDAVLGIRAERELQNYIYVHIRTWNKTQQNNTVASNLQSKPPCLGRAHRKFIYVIKYHYTMYTCRIKDYQSIKRQYIVDWGYIRYVIETVPKLSYLGAAKAASDSNHVTQHILM